MQNNQSFWKKITPFIIIVLVVIGLMFVMRLLRDEPQTQARQETGFLVETVQLEPQSLTIEVSTQGVLIPKRSISLVAEVSGRVVSVDDSFVVGGQFKQGDVLLQIETDDYQVAVARAEANLASARASLDLEQAKAEQAEKDWQSFGKKSKPSDLLLNIPQLKGAQAAVDAAKADLQKARRDLSKTTIRAPFAGAVLAKQVDIGQFVNVSGQLGRLAGSEVAEIRLPLTDRQLEQLKLTHSDRLPLPVNLSLVDGPKVGEAQLVRLEPEKDPQTLMTYGVVEVREPFDLGLRFNTFVQADIIGPTYDNVFAVPAEWLLPKQRLPLYRNDRLHIQSVTVIEQSDELDYISEGLSTEDQIITTPIQFPEQGMVLRRQSISADSPSATSENNSQADESP
ncbi:RND superfamily efflux pump MFP component [Marinicella pacifica]|uniref:RND superfamily efflux pump MFP component n=1 Tax=Marinicella pacifica TaxID=1171543 RepID=A0A917CJ96_9GAMM|nr:efflux RND transporter periplasmic adaptor subunit [Marinicella pacifica]GGF87558.1 RND superfamily efflux pump MFP component [Marinicella pacifica]